MVGGGGGRGGAGVRVGRVGVGARVVPVPLGVLEARLVVVQLVVQVLLAVRLVLVVGAS